ncbi:hypothetical protein LWI28_002513 [Acer negundo]|uniref:Uncharacterized protein n=1 Tax=Acer negundo TaxID=4023 RepID=A0AAD5I4V5_ACENE|nr:hypothetical protein LWI28_002513 [Acer negundo]
MEPPVLDDHGIFPPLGTPLGTTPRTAPVSESYKRKRETQSQREVMGKTRQKQELEKEVLESFRFISFTAAVLAARYVSFNYMSLSFFFIVLTVACVTETMEPPVLDDHDTFPPLGTPLSTTHRTAPVSESYTRKRETQSQREAMGKMKQKQEFKKEVLESFHFLSSSCSGGRMVACVTETMETPVLDDHSTFPPLGTPLVTTPGISPAVAYVTGTMEPPVLDNHGTFPPLGTPLGTTPGIAPVSESYTRKR